MVISVKGRVSTAQAKKAVKAGIYVERNKTKKKKKNVAFQGFKRTFQKK